MKRLVLLAAVTLSACDNAGASRVSGITATGVIRGSVYFDANGSRSEDAADVPRAGARLRLLSLGARDTILRATTAPDGTFRLSGVPVGTYAMVIDSTSGGDSAIVIPPSAPTVTVVPNDSVEWVGSLSFPIRTIAQARTLAPGTTRVFVTGVALNARTTFSDTTLHLVDVGGAIRATRVRPSTVAFATGDSIRVRARVATRLGQVVLDDVTVFIIGATFVPPAPTLSTLQASIAQSGARDADLIRLSDAQVTDSATVGGNLTMTFNDGSGPVTVVLDRAADIGFRSPFPPGEYRAPNRYDVTGVLVPTGIGTWVVKPRSPLDLVRR